jgi:hypothetical protein
MRRGTVVVFVFALLLTLAPRTSQFLSANWDAAIHTNTLGDPDHDVQRLVFAAIPTTEPAPTTTFTVEFSAGAAQLLGSNAGCTVNSTGTVITCEVQTAEGRKQYVVAMTVRSVGSEQLSYELKAP